jgi:hypothetical protein
MSSVWDPSWVFSPELAPKSEQFKHFSEQVRILILEVLGDELANSSEMVEYVATLITSHKPMFDVLLAIAEVMGEENLPPVADLTADNSPTFFFTQQLFQLAQKLSVDYVPTVVPQIQSSGAAASSRLFASAVAGVKQSSRASASEAEGARSRKRQHEDGSGGARDAPSRKIVVVKRGDTMEGVHGREERPREGGYGHPQEEQGSPSPGPLRHTPAYPPAYQVHSRPPPQPAMGLPDYGRPGITKVIREDSAGDVEMPIGRDAYSGVHRPGAHEEGAEGTPEQAPEYAGRGGYRGRGRGRGRGGSSAPSQQAIQMALSIVSQMAAAGGMGGMGMPYMGRGGYAGGMGGMGMPYMGRGGYAGVPRGGAVRGRGGHGAAARDSKWVNQSQTPCKFGDACRNNPCPFGHERAGQGASTNPCPFGHERAGQGAGAPAPFADVLPRKSSKFGTGGTGPV